MNGLKGANAQVHPTEVRVCVTTTFATACISVVAGVSSKVYAIGNDSEVVDSFGLRLSSLSTVSRPSSGASLRFDPPWAYSPHFRLSLSEGAY